MLSRREFNQMLAAAVPATYLLRLINPAYEGVRFGTITYSFRDVPYVAGKPLADEILKDCQEAGLGLIELMSNQVEPVTPYIAAGVAKGGRDGNGLLRGVFPNTPEGQKARDELRRWRLSTPDSYFAGIREQYLGAGVTIYAYTVNGFGNDFTNDEIDRMFAQAKAIGAVTIASSATLSAARRLVPFVEKHRYPVAFHNHTDLTDPNQLCTPESMAKVLAMSKYFKLNVDVGHYVQSNFDPIPLIEKYHARITHLHVADGRRNNGSEVPFGTGDTPLKGIVMLLKGNRYPIPALVELEYPVPPGSSSPAQVKKCIDYLHHLMA